MHVPLLTEQALQQGRPGLALDQQCLGVQVALETALRVTADRHESGGSIA